jgi:hypothetical protein
MQPIRARIIAVVASWILVMLASLGLAELGPGVAEQIADWVDKTFELVLLLGYALIHPRLERLVGGIRE